MRGRLLIAIAFAALSSGCYHVTVVSGAPPAPQTIDRPWQNSFVHGLVPPSEIATKDSCAAGVASVETERSFLNGLVAMLTSEIYTPMHARITCAAGPVSR